MAHVINMKHASDLAGAVRIDRRTVWGNPYRIGAALCAIAGTIGLIAEQAGIAHGWAVFPGVTALFAWIAFERRTRR